MSGVREALKVCLNKIVESKWIKPTFEAYRIQPRKPILAFISLVLKNDGAAQITHRNSEPIAAPAPWTRKGNWQRPVQGAGEIVRVLRK